MLWDDDWGRYDHCAYCGDPATDRCRRCGASLCEVDSHPRDGEDVLEEFSYCPPCWSRRKDALLAKD